MASATQTNLKSIPDEWLPQVLYFIRSFPNDTSDFSKPHLRQSLLHIYPFFIAIYALLLVSGTVANTAMMLHILRKRLHKKPTCAFLLNMGANNLITCLFVLPISLTILLIQNWIYGSFLCYVVPMLQDLPMHSSMQSLVLISADRYRKILHPGKSRLPPFAAIMCTWVISLCVVMPYAVYMNYFKLEPYMGKRFQGVGICTVNMGIDTTDYIRGLFLFLYVFPLLLIAFLNNRVSVSIKKKEASSRSDIQEVEGDFQQEVWNSQRDRFPFRVMESAAHPGLRHQSSDPLPRGLQCPSPSYAEEFRGERRYGRHHEQIDSKKEKRNQHYVVTLSTAYAFCLCPLMLLRVVKNMVLETYAISAHFDMTYITFVWIAFLPTITTPCFYTAWKLSRNAKDRLQGYFRFSNRQERRPVPDEGSGVPNTLVFEGTSRTTHRLSLEPVISPSAYALLSMSNPQHSHDLWAPMLPSPVEKHCHRPRVHSFHT